MSLTKKQLEKQVNDLKKEMDDMLEYCASIIAHKDKMMNYYKTLLSNRGEGEGIWYWNEAGSEPEYLIETYEELKYGEKIHREEQGLMPFEEEWEHYYGYKYPKHLDDDEE
jgi:hypothetical protein